MPEKNSEAVNLLLRLPTSCLPLRFPILASYAPLNLLQGEVHPADKGARGVMRADEQVLLAVAVKDPKVWLSAV